MQLWLCEASGLDEQAAEALDEFGGQIDWLEATSTKIRSEELGEALVSLRPSIIAMSRHLAPQREILTHLISSRVEWLGERVHNQLKDVLDTVIRYLEGLDEVKERLVAIHDFQVYRLSERVNLAMLLLALNAAILLPLSLLTGILGINRHSRQRQTLGLKEYTSKVVTTDG